MAFDRELVVALIILDSRISKKEFPFSEKIYPEIGHGSLSQHLKEGAAILFNLSLVLLSIIYGEKSLIDLTMIQNCNIWWLKFGIMTSGGWRQK